MAIVILCVLCRLRSIERGDAIQIRDMRIAQVPANSESKHGCLSEKEDGGVREKE
jgi:hypothetical protein